MEERQISDLICTMLEALSGHNQSRAETILKDEEWLKTQETKLKRMIIQAKKLVHGTIELESRSYSHHSFTSPFEQEREDKDGILLKRQARLESFMILIIKKTPWMNWTILYQRYHDTIYESKAFNLRCRKCYVPKLGQKTNHSSAALEWKLSSTSWIRKSHKVSWNAKLSSAVSDGELGPIRFSTCSEVAHHCPFQPTRSSRVIKSKFQTIPNQVPVQKTRVKNMQIFSNPWFKIELNHDANEENFWEMELETEQANQLVPVWLIVSCLIHIASL
jgi:hypothetical protein